MQTTIQGVRIDGICATVPQHISYFEDELKYFPFPEKSSRRLAKVMGFCEHRISDAATSPCDLASYTLDALFQRKLLDKEELSSIVVVAQQADHPIPGNSKVIHGQLGLPSHIHCIDQYENCIGFISGLFTACSLISGAGLKTVALITTDAGACYANIKDRNTYPLCGDAASVTIVRRSTDVKDKISFIFRHDGSRREALIVPAGGMRMPNTSETARMTQDSMGNFRSLQNLHMDGTAVFQFVMEEVPLMIREACSFAGITPQDIQYHLTHQPNRFMLEKLADLLNVPRKILFNNIVEHFGNSSPSTIPVNVTYNLGKRLLSESPLVCFSAFGAGLSLACAIGHLGKLAFCDLLEHPGGGVFHYGE